ncbi:MAG: hypothetical protein JO053_09290 [Acidobacteria bacterium]|nr:hypothetical protein [Acidobacteriota bacterium]
MAGFFKSKVGWILTGVYLLTVALCLGYYLLVDRFNLIAVIGYEVLTLPWSWFVPELVVKSGITGVTYDVASHKHDDVILLVEHSIFAMVNAAVIYVFGYLVEKAAGVLKGK